MTSGLLIIPAILAGTFLLSGGGPDQGAGRSGKDAGGDLLPGGVLARIGTRRFRQAGWVSAVAYSPDGRTVASGGTDGAVHVWEVGSGRELWGRTSNHPLESFGSIAFSPDGTKVAAAGKREIWVWSAAAGEELRRLEGPGDGLAVAFSPDGRELACQSSDGAVLRWEVASGKESARLEGLKSATEAAIPCLAYSPDGALLALGGSADVRLFSSSTAKEVRRLTGHQAPVTSLAFSKDGKLLVTTGTDGTVRLWESASGEEILNLPGPKFPRSAPRQASNPPTLLASVIALSPDGKRLAVGGGGPAPLGELLFAQSPSGDRDIHLWDLDSGHDVGVLRGHEPSFSAFAFSPDGRILVAACDHSVILWDVPARRELPGPEGPRSPVRELAFSPDGKTLATSAETEGFIRIWDLATGRERARFSPDEYSTSMPSPLAYSPDGKTLVRTLIPFFFWDASTGAERRIHSRTDPSDWRGGAFAFAPDSKSFFVTARTTTAPGRIRHRDLATGQHLRSFAGKEAEASSLAVSPDGKLLAAGYWDGSVWLWDAGSGQKLWTGHLAADPATREKFGRFGHDPNLIASLAPHVHLWFGPEGRTLTGVWGASVAVWTAATGRALQELEGGWGESTALTLSPDGKTLAGWKADEVHLWELATGQEYFKVPAGRPSRVHYSNLEDGLGAFAFSPDGRSLAVRSDSTVLLWDLLRAGLAPEVAGEEGGEKAWKDLGSKEAREARAAMESLIRAGDRAVDLLARRLAPPPLLRKDELGALLGALASDDASRRDEASRALREGSTQGQLEELLGGKLPEETAGRLREILKAWNARIPQERPELRSSRAIEVLERIGSPKAAELLDTEVATARLFREQEDARLALSRLESKSK